MLNEGVDVLNSYGATESLPISKLASQELFDTSAETDSGAGICVGYPIDGVDIAIIDVTEDVISEWDNGLALEKNQIGEIVVAGDMVNQGYYQRALATEQAKVFDKQSGRMRHRMGDLGYIDAKGRLWMCGRKAHRVETGVRRYYSIPCERIFNTHPQVKRSALVAVTVSGKTVPLICLELNKASACSSSAQLYAELISLAEQYPHTDGITHFLLHDGFPMDVRHNAKIFREKLAVWAQKRI